MRLWRISAYPGLDGVGGLHLSGRWHSRPRAIIYTCEHPALALAEMLPKLKLGMAQIPLTLKLVGIDIQPGASRARTPMLPSGWQANEPTTRAIGNAWLDAGETLLLPVPSSLIAHSRNYLINAAHAQLHTHVHETVIEPFWFDRRYLPQTRAVAHEK